ncbi:MAG: phosphoglycerate kinase [Bacillota bacterium]
MIQKKSIEDIEIRDKKILVRVDFNVPLDSGEVRDDSRIRAALPTIKKLIDAGAHVILGSHLGRPKGQPRPELKMDPVATRLSELLGSPVKKVDEVVGPLVNEAISAMEGGDVILLENLRFEEGEEKNDPSFARKLAKPVDIFVNDAFGTAHRAHASTVGITEFVAGVAGLLMKKEIEELSYCMGNPSRPFTAILGGAKVSDKIKVIYRFLQLADNLLIGGGMANTFLAARGFNLGDSFYEKDLLNEAAEVIRESERSRCRLVMPVDLVVAEELKTGSPQRIVYPEEVRGSWKVYDIGPETINTFATYLDKSSMIVWNGPMGVYEIPPFNYGTEQLALIVAQCGAHSVVGGGDLVAALEAQGLAEKISFISTGGGATLEFWEGRELPGVSALQDK